MSWGAFRLHVRDALERARETGKPTGSPERLPRPTRTELIEIPWDGDGPDPLAEAV